MARYKLKLKKLNFISPVDSPAQETATVRLLKRKNGVRGEIDGFARVAKIDDVLGLVFCWAFTSKAAGDDYYDLHDDCIDEDFVKAAMDFMQGARATDEMHDREVDGQVVFAMPMTSEIAKAFGIETDTVGLMVALKPSAEVFEKFKTGEYTGVSIDGLGIREEVEKSKPISTKKRSALTSAALGHTHLIYGLDDSMAGSTSYESTYEEDKPRDCYTGHCHPWVRGADGSITVGEAMGHTHDVGVMSAALSKKKPGDGDGGAPAQPALDTRSKSTTANAVPKVEPTTEPRMSNTPDHEKQIADLTKRVERAERIAKMSGAHKTHFDTLSGDDADAFLAKSNAERAAVLAELEKANEVVYTSKSDGTVYRKSDDPRLVAMAKREDARVEEIAKERGEKLDAIYKAKAGEVLSNFTKSIDARTLIVKSVMSSGAEQAVIDEAIESLKGANAAYALLAKMQGVTPTDDAAASGDPLSKFNTKLAEFAKSKGKSPAEATSEFLKTTEGAELYEEFSTSRYAEH